MAILAVMLKNDERISVIIFVLLVGRAARPSGM